MNKAKGRNEHYAWQREQIKKGHAPDPMPEHLFNAPVSRHPVQSREENNEKTGMTRELQMANPNKSGMAHHFEDAE
jgi:hypothetical protein